MSRRLRNNKLLSAMDSAELRGFASYLSGGRWQRDNEGHDDSVDEDDEDEDEDDEHERTDDDEPKDKKKKPGKARSQEDEDDDDEEPMVPQWKYDRLDRRMRAADKRSSSLQQAIDDLKAAGTDKLDEQTKKDINELRPKAQRLERDNASLRMQIAFLTTPIKGLVWTDPEAALQLADLSDVDIDPETGKVDKRALATALRDLAKRKPYLVEKKRKQQEDEQDEEEDEPAVATTRSMNGKRKGQKPQATDKEALAKRFPVLRR